MSSDMIKIDEILEIMPHRYPILLIDRIEKVKEKEAVAKKNVTINEPFFQGHFPDKPIFPGVLIIEAMAQASAILLYNGSEYRKEEKDTFFLGMDKVKIKNKVIPGDTLKLHVKIEKEKKFKKGTILKIKGEAKVEDRICAKGVLTVGAFDK